MQFLVGFGLGQPRVQHSHAWRKLSGFVTSPLLLPFAIARRGGCNASCSYTLDNLIRQHCRLPLAPRRAEQTPSRCSGYNILLARQTRPREHTPSIYTIAVSTASRIWTEMVTRTPVGPPLATSSKQTDANNANPPYPVSPVLRTPVLDSAKHLHGAKSIYSPDLGNSPAFDLIDMEQARQRPRRDSDVSSHGTWDSDDTERDTPEEADLPKPLRITPSKQNMRNEDGHRNGDLPAILRPGPAEGARGRKSMEETDAQANPWALPVEQPHTNVPQADGGVGSSNPYRHQNGAFSETSQAAWEEARPAAPLNAPPAPPVELPAVRTPADELSRMSLGEETQPESPALRTAEVLPVPQFGQPPLASVVEQHQQESQNFYSNNPWRRPSQEDVERVERDQAAPSAPGPPAPPKAVAEEPSELHYAPPPGPPPKSESNTSLIDHQESASDSPAAHGSAQQQINRPAPISTAHPPASLSTTSAPETPQTSARNQPSESYQIKHVNWHDASSASNSRSKNAMRRSPILTQNANGPCPLLALVNALVLSTPQDLDTALVETLRTREQVSLGLLLDAVFDELMFGKGGDIASELPDVGELYSFLRALHTGMNVNPRFVTPAHTPRGSLDGHPPDMSGVHPAERAQSKPGCFEETKEMRLYSTFNIPLIHGWTAPNDTPAYAAFARSAQTFEEAQNIQFAVADLEHKLRSEGLSPEEQQTLQDIDTIKAFLTNWPTQLTDHGLETISASLRSGQIAILFRNDHFSTLYKEPKHGALMTLVTDAGYSSHDEIVWESLVDVNGAASEMFSGDFRVVSHGHDVGRLNQGNSAGGEEGWKTVRGRQQLHDQRSQNQEMPSRLANATPNDGHDTAPPLPGPRPTSRQDGSVQGSTGDDTVLGHVKSSEQEDHDLALALQLQEEEEDQQRQAEQRRRREQELSEQFLEHEGEGPRPPIPPRRSGNDNNNNNNRASAAPPSGRLPVTRRPSNPDAPPTYEQSASDRPYRPAGSTAPPSMSQGNPLSAYDALRRQSSSSSPYAQQNSASGHGRRVSGPVAAAAAANRTRRSSQVAAGAMPGSSYQGGMPPGAPGTSNGRVSQAAGVKEVEEKCVIM